MPVPRATRRCWIRCSCLDGDVDGLSGLRCRIQKAVGPCAAGSGRTANAAIGAGTERSARASYETRASKIYDQTMLPTMAIGKI